MSAASFERARRTATALAAALCVAGALAACGRTGGSPDEAPPSPPPAEQPLAGAPDVAATPPDAEREAPISAPPSPPADAAPMEAPSAAPSGLVAMAPIPNPPERAAPRRVSGRRFHVHRRRHGRGHARRAYAETCPPRTSGRFGASDACVARALREERRHGTARPMAPRHAATTAAPQVASHPAARPHPPTLRHGGRHAGARHPAPGAAPGAVERTARLQSVGTALAAEVARTATLTSPHVGPGVAADVMLNVPASFAETLRAEAGRQGLADDAASAALVARLSGAGYTVLPEGEQRQMIAAGQPTVFHWTVTGQPGARGPLQASVAAQLLGGAAQDRMDLGQVTGARTDDGLGWRIAGVALLVLLVAGGVGLLARRQRPARRPDDGVIRRREPFTLRDDDRPPV